MALGPGEVMKVSWNLSTTDVNEICTFGVHTGFRAADADVLDMINAAAAYWSGGVSSQLAAHTLQSIVVSQWQTTPGFVGWHQRLSMPYATTGGSGEQEPHQLAAVVGYKANSTGLGDWAIGRMRNRFYLGPLAKSTIAATGYLTSSFVTNQLTLLEGLHDALVAVGGAATGFNGLVIVSPTQGAYREAQTLTLGKAVDTMRSRRQKSVEAPATNFITPG